MKKNGYLKEAKRIYTYAKKEYAQAKKQRNDLKTIQAAEKVYLCLLKTVNVIYKTFDERFEDLERLIRKVEPGT